MTIYTPSRIPEKLTIGKKYDLTIVDRGGIRYTPEKLEELSKILYETKSGGNAMSDEERKKFAKRCADGFLMHRTDLFPVLDDCCGLGDTIEEYMRRGIPCVGLDIDRGQLEKADYRMNEDKINPILVHGDAHNLPFEDNSFGGITYYGALMMIPFVRRILEGRDLSEDEIRKEIVCTLSEKRRVLRDGGEVHLITSSENNKIRFSYHGSDFTYYELRPEELEELVGVAGLKPLHIGYYEDWNDDFWNENFIDAKLKKV